LNRYKHLLKILLLQVREAEKVKREEHESFARYCGLQKNQIKILNVFEQPDFSLNCIKGFNALLVGGASDASVLEPEKYTFVPRCQELLSHCANNAMPVFASCFGFQLAALALDGTILHDGSSYEMGTMPILTTKEAEDDPLFNGTGRSFYAVSVHKEKAINVPEGTIELAYTKMCSHSFRIRNKPFWAFQFHPEVDKATLVERLTYYKSKYTEDDSHLDKVLTAARETPKANGLCKKFIDNVLLAD
jgi:GMP synthase (glutamine-hydrolysing)